MMLATQPADPFVAFAMDLGPRPAIGERVDVYRNLHHGKGPIHYWSVRETRAPRHVLVVAAYVVLRDAEFRVSLATHQKVIAKGKREIHAWAVGEVVAWDEHRSPARRPRDLVRFTYNPFRADFFHLADSARPEHPEHLTRVERSPLMWFDREGAWMRL